MYLAFSVYRHYVLIIKKWLLWTRVKIVIILFTYPPLTKEISDFSHVLVV